MTAARLLTLFATAIIGAGCAGGGSSTSSVGQVAARPSASATGGPSAVPPTAKRDEPKEQSSKRTKKDLIEALKADPELGLDDLPRRAGAVLVDCMADVLLKYADRRSLTRYVDGKIGLDAVKGADSPKAEKAGFACADAAYQAR